MATVAIYFTNVLSDSNSIFSHSEEKKFLQTVESKFKVSAWKVVASYSVIQVNGSYL